MKQIFLFSLLLINIGSVFGQAYTIQTIPDPKKNGGGYVSDPDNLLTEVTESRLNTMLQELEDSTTAQAAVVIVNSIGDQVPKDFATSLFNLWGIGQADKDNGFLLLVVMDQRRMEMETGYGTETVLTDINCKRIQDAYMVPLFKGGMYEEGILQGMEQVCLVLKDPTAVAELEEMSDGSSSSGDAFYVLWFVSLFYYIPAIVMFFIIKQNKLFTHLHDQATGKNSKKAPIPQIRWLGLYIVAPFVLLLFVTFTGLYLIYFILCYLLIIAFFLEKRIRCNAFIKEHTRSDPYELYKANKKSHQYWGVLALLIPLPFLFYYISYKMKQRTLRSTPRICKKCNQQMKRLGEKADDTYLREGQILEEKLRAVDYDVWDCESCSNQLIQSYVNFWSRYKKCEFCNYKTQYVYKTETLVAATYDSSGKGLKTYLCKHCNRTKEVTYTIPRKTRSSSGSGSSSGGSWGGGSSGGGGAGSSW